MVGDGTGDNGAAPAGPAGRNAISRERGRVAGADLRDFEAVYAANATRFRRVAAAALRGAGLSDQAEDVVSQAVLGLWRSPPSEVENWESLIVVAIKRRAIDLIRSADIRHSDRTAAPPAIGVTPQADDADDWHQRRLDTGRHVTGGDYGERQDPSQACERDQQVEAVRAAISRLPSPDREIVIRIKLNEEMGKAVAADLGISPGRVSQILKRAMNALSQEASLEEVR